MKKLLLLTVILISSVTSSYASHIMGGDITYTCLGNDVYQVTLTLYRDCAGISIGTGTQTVSFNSACGNQTVQLPWVSTTEVSQLCGTAISTCNGGSQPGTEAFVFTGQVTLPPCADWIMSWNTCCRNNAITNLATTSASIYLQTTLNSVAASCNNSPQFFNLPTPYLCANNLAIYSHAASDIDGDSLYYSFNDPLTTPGPPGTPIGFAAGYSLSQPVITSSGMNFDQTTGEMCFTPSQGQNVVISVLIQEYRNGVLIGSVIREMQVVVDPSCTNQNPTTGSAATCGGAATLILTHQGPTVVQTDPNSVIMCPNDSVCFEVNFSDPDGDNITLTSNALAAISGGIFTVTNNGTPNPVATFCWVPTPLDSGLNVFAIIATDDACPISGTQSFVFDITVFDQPFAGLDQTTCGTQGVQLSASGGATYTWFDVATNIQIPVGPEFSCNPCANPIATPMVTTNYYVLSSIAAACTNTDTVLITVTPDFTLDAIGDTILCDFLTKQLDVNITSGPSGVYTYVWNNAATLNNNTIQNPIASPIQSTWYVVEATSPLGCIKLDSAFVQVVPPPNVTLIPGNSTVCQGETVNFGVITPSCQITTTFTGQDDDPGVSTIVSNFTCVPTGAAITSITIDAAFTGTFCGATSWYTYDIIINGTTQFTQQCNQTGLDLSAFLPITSIAISVNDEDNFSDNVTLNLAVNVSYIDNSFGFSWSPGIELSDSLINDPVLTANTFGVTTYTVTITDTATGCAIDRTQDITVTPNHTINSIPNDTNICIGETINFSAIASPAGAYNYSWTSTTGVLGTPLVANTAGTFNIPGTDTVVITVNNNVSNCTNKDTIFVNVAAIPSVNITTPDTLLNCINNISLNLDLGTAPIPNDYSFDWNFGSTLNDSTLQNPNATPNGAISNYIVIVTDTLGGCFDSDTVEVKSCCITPTISFTDVTCNGFGDGKIITSAIALNSNVTFEFHNNDLGFTQLQTSTGNSSDSILNLIPGSYIVVIKDSIGCSFNDTITITQPTPVITSNVSPDSIICINGTATLYATGSGGTTPTNLIWDNGLIGNGPHNVNPAIITTYHVFAQDVNGCISSIDSMTINLFPPIIINSLIVSRDTICAGDTATLFVNAIGGGTDLIYTWINGNGILLGTTSVDSFIVAPTFTGEIFTVTVSDSCTTPSQSATIPVYWAPAVSPNYTAINIEGCFPVVTTLINTTPNINIMDSVLWTFGDGAQLLSPFSDSTLHSYNNPGIYNITLTITDNYGCNWDTVITDFQVSAYDYPKAEFSWTPKPTDYLNAEITFNNGSIDNLMNEWVINADVQFTSNLVNPIYQFPQDTSGLYEVTLKVTNEFGCQDSILETVTINDAFLFFVPNSFTPDGDGLNDTFKAYGGGVDFSNYSIQIYNRWGALIYSSNNAASGWDGTYNGSPAVVGTYIWKIIAKENITTIIHDNFGYVTLIR